MYRHLLPLLYFLLLGFLNHLTAQPFISNPPLPPENGDAFPVYALEALPELVDSSVLPKQEGPWRYLPYGYDIPGRWEMGVHLFPWLHKEAAGLRRMTSTEVSDLRPQTLIATTGESYVLFSDGFSQVQLPAQPVVVFLQVDVARQFGSGFRAGISVALYNNLSGSQVRIEDLINLPNSPDYAQFFSFDERGSYINLHGQYTFNRRGRFRPSIGLIYVTGLAYKNTSTSTLYDGPNEQLVILNSNIITDRSQLVTNFMMPQLSLQYQLSRHTSVGLELAIPVQLENIPFATIFGIGARYQFGKGWPSYFDKR